MTRRAFACLLALSLPLMAGSCATTLPFFALHGNSRSLSRLAGKWEGTFSATGSSGIRGSLRLEVRPGSSFGRGHVRTLGAPGIPAMVLAVRQIRMTGLVLEGEFEPFVDPGCACMAKTTFSATLRDNRLDGRYTTRLATGVVRTGRWHADRRVRQRGWFRWGGE